MPGISISLAFCSGILGGCLTTISPTSVPGILGIMVLWVTVLFMFLAVISLLPRPGWLFKVLAWTGGRRRAPVPGPWRQEAFYAAARDRR